MSARFIRLRFQRIRTLNADLMSPLFNTPENTTDTIVARRVRSACSSMAVSGVFRGGCNRCTAPSIGTWEKFERWGKRKIEKGSDERETVLTGRSTYTSLLSRKGMKTCRHFSSDNFCWEQFFIFLQTHPWMASICSPSIPKSTDRPLIGEHLPHEAGGGDCLRKTSPS